MNIFKTVRPSEETQKLIDEINKKIDSAEKAKSDTPELQTKIIKLIKDIENLTKKFNELLNNNKNVVKINEVSKDIEKIINHEKDEVKGELLEKQLRDIGSIMSFNPKIINAHDKIINEMLAFDYEIKKINDDIKGHCKNMIVANNSIIEGTKVDKIKEEKQQLLKQQNRQLQAEKQKDKEKAETRQKYVDKAKKAFSFLTPKKDGRRKKRKNSVKKRSLNKKRSQKKKRSLRK